MNTKLIAVVSSFASLAATAAVESAAIRVDTRVADLDGRIAHGLEQVGEPDGSASSAWNTTNRLYDASAEYPDGWYGRNERGVWVRVEDGNVASNAYVINDWNVTGGRRTESGTWPTGTVHVVRHNTVATNGVEVVIAPEAVVQFAEGARLVQAGGAFRAQGAFFDDAFRSTAEDWFLGFAEGSYRTIKMLDGAEEVAHARTYTRGEVYGRLPAYDKYEDGWWFRGWRKSPEAAESVSADEMADMTIPALYCNWELIYLTPSTTLVEFPAYSPSVERTVTVASNDAWQYAKNASWLTVTDDGTVSNGVLTITATENRSDFARSATITLSRKNGRLSQEITVLQPAMAHAATPELATGTGLLTFNDYVETIWITCATTNATVWYTTDGSDPSPTNGSILETERIEREGVIVGWVDVYGSTTVKAMAVRDDLQDSKIGELGVVQDCTLAEAMDIPDQYVTTGGDAEWFVTTDGASDGVSCVKSGKMATSVEKRKTTRLEMVVEGSGTVSFKWKVSCERDRSTNGKANWDYLAFISDGVVQRKIEGQSGWETVTVTLTGDTYHILNWIYSKNAAKYDMDPGEDCAWVDQVKWTPATFVENKDGSVREVVVDTTVLRSLGLVGASEADAANELTKDYDGDGFTNEQELILGTNPYDADDKFSVSIRSLDEENGMEVDYPVNAQNKNYEVEYRVLGAKTLGQGFDDVTDFTQEEKRDYKFFKVWVDYRRVK